MKTKTLLLLVFFIFMQFQVKSQTIMSLTILPPNPTPTDTLTFLADCMFPSANCDDHTQYISMSGTDLIAGALHCLGPMTVICHYTDTFIVNPLPAGNYTFNFQLDAGFGPSPCSPGIVPGPGQSLNFVVAPFTDITEYISNDAASVFPNPFNDHFQITGIEKENFPVYVEIFSIEGKLVKYFTLSDITSNIKTSDLPAASYQVYLTTKNKEQYIVPVIKK